VCGVTGSFRRILVVAGAVVVLGASGCSRDDKGPVDPPTQPSPTVSAVSPSLTPSPTGTAEEQILAQYRRFWTETLPMALAAPAVERPRVLAPVVSDPLVPELLRVASLFEKRNQRPTGSPNLIRQAVYRKGSSAIVVGCIDESGFFLTDKATGETSGRGRARAPSQTRLKKGTDGVWRVYSVKDLAGQRC
jgi:hypothetical protein